MFFHSVPNQTEETKVTAPSLAGFGASGQHDRSAFSTLFRKIRNTLLSSSDPGLENTSAVWEKTTPTDASGLAEKLDQQDGSVLFQQVKHIAHSIIQTIANQFRGSAINNISVCLPYPDYITRFDINQSHYQSTLWNIL